VVRDLVNRLLEKQLQERTAAASMEMLRIRETARNVLLSVVAIILAIVFADHEKFLANLKNLLGRRAPDAALVHPPNKPPDRTP
jgi:hypothetical protein